jgi:hypothetical protein
MDLCNPEDGGKMDLRNVDILPQQYKATQLGRTQLGGCHFTKFFLEASILLTYITVSGLTDIQTSLILLQTGILLLWNPED